MCSLMKGCSCVGVGCGAGLRESDDGEEDNLALISVSSGRPASISIHSHVLRTFFFFSFIPKPLLFCSLLFQRLYGNKIKFETLDWFLCWPLAASCFGFNPKKQEHQTHESSRPEESKQPVSGNELSLNWTNFYFYIFMPVFMPLRAKNSRRKRRVDPRRQDYLCHGEGRCQASRDSGRKRGQTGIEHESLHRSHPQWTSDGG